MPNTILLKGDMGSFYEEGRAAASILPGMALAKNTSGLLIPHGTAVGNWNRGVAIEDALIGKTTVDAYASGDLVRYHQATPGEVLYMRLAASQTIVINDQLVSNGDGYLKKVVTATSDDIFGFAEEAVTTSGSTGWVKIRIK
jgi:hypothetical protein